MKTKTQIAALFAVVSLFMVACSTPAPEATTPAPAAIDMEALKVEIQAMEDAFAAGEKAKDADAVAAYYSDDAISYGRNNEPTVGKAAIRDSIAAGIAKDSLGHTNVYKVVDLFAEGNMAIEIGSFTKLDSAGAEVDRGHYMSYFQKRDGKYVCVRDMNVTSLPPKPKM